ncbi:MAG: sulfite exporter TauE/SafE family protein [Bacillaceae bacterium]|nr:sulfite exporter TauE/SafE family protein [Bacillaceae bacterium]
MELVHILLILAAGTAGGFLNTVAGGGSLLTLPVLIFMGLPSAVANGTNRIALMVQNIVAVASFRQKGYFDWKFSILLGIPAILGSIVGANLAISLPDEIFNKILAVIMIMVLILILWQPEKKFLQSEQENLSKGRRIAAAIAFFFVGVYGGFIQAGVGFIIIAALTLITGMSLVRINSIKVFVVGIYMLASLIVFIWNDQVNWVLGLTLAVGNGFGAWLGSLFSVSGGDKWIRFILAVAIIMMAVKLLLGF